jgi:hypothetical protein
MPQPKNQRSFDAATGEVVLTTARGEEAFRRKARTPLEALVEFKYACDAWMACMDPETRAAAVEFAKESAANVPFSPNCEAR